MYKLLMPYKIVKVQNGYKVKNTKSNKTYSKKSLPKTKAEKQMKAIGANYKK